MTAPLDDRYFEWLYGLVGSVRNRNPARSHWKLLRQKYVKEFVWFVPNDDNRVEDGKELRYEFLRQQGIDKSEVDESWLQLGCSVLEMILALSRRASFEYDRMTPGEWFWTMLEHLGLRRITDERYNDELGQHIDETLDAVIYRTYSPSGKGGLFPLNSSPNDQRKIEIWYQLAEYIIEVYPF